MPKNPYAGREAGTQSVGVGPNNWAGAGSNGGEAPFSAATGFGTDASGFADFEGAFESPIGVESYAPTGAPPGAEPGFWPPGEPQETARPRAPASFPPYRDLAPGTKMFANDWRRRARRLAARPFAPRPATAAPIGAHDRAPGAAEGALETALRSGGMPSIPIAPPALGDVEASDGLGPWAGPEAGEEAFDPAWSARFVRPARSEIKTGAGGASDNLGPMDSAPIGRIEGNPAMPDGALTETWGMPRAEGETRLDASSEFSDGEAGFFAQAREPSGSIPAGRAWEEQESLGDALRSGAMPAIPLNIERAAQAAPRPSRRAQESGDQGGLRRGNRDAGFDPLTGRPMGGRAERLGGIDAQSIAGNSAIPDGAMAELLKPGPSAQTVKLDASSRGKSGRRGDSPAFLPHPWSGSPKMDSAVSEHAPSGSDAASKPGRVTLPSFEPEFAPLGAEGEGNGDGALASIERRRQGKKKAPKTKRGAKERMFKSKENKKGAARRREVSLDLDEDGDAMRPRLAAVSGGGAGGGAGGIDPAELEEREETRGWLGWIGFVLGWGMKLALLGMTIAVAVLGFKTYSMLFLSDPFDGHPPIANRVEPEAPESLRPSSRIGAKEGKEYVFNPATVYDYSNVPDMPQGFGDGAADDRGGEELGEIAEGDAAVSELEPIIPAMDNETARPDASGRSLGQMGGGRMDPAGGRQGDLDALF